MKNFTVNQKVIVPSGRLGTIKAIAGMQATIWFTEDGTDIGYFNLSTLKLGE